MGFVDPPPIICAGSGGISGVGGLLLQHAQRHLDAAEGGAHLHALERRSDGLPPYR